MKTLKNIIETVFATITAVQMAKAKNIIKNGYTRRWE
jgi:hypothetical protein